MRFQALAYRVRSIPLEDLDRSPDCEAFQVAKNAPTGSVVSPGGNFSRPATRKSPCLPSWAHFCHSAPVETHAFGFRLGPTVRRANSDFLLVVVGRVRSPATHVVQNGYLRRISSPPAQQEHDPNRVVGIRP
jgi:hypothetical protein